MKHASRTKSLLLLAFITALLAAFTAISFAATATDAEGTAALSATNTTDEAQTKYGTIPEAYLDKTAYPIVLFKDGEFIGGYDVFANGNNDGGVMSQIKEKLDGKPNSEIGGTMQVLFRGNATATGTYANVGQILGNVIFDLNGYTLTQTYTSNALINTEAKYYKGMQDCSFTFINGGIVLKTNLVCFAAYGKSYAEAEGFKTFNLTFNNVAFSYAEGSSSTAFLAKHSDPAAVKGKKVGYNIEFNDCTFDVRNASGLSTLFNAKDTNFGTNGLNCVIDLSVKGGSILATSGSTVWAEYGANGSLARFEKNAEGKLTDLTLTTAADTIENGVESSLGELEFVKTSLGEGGNYYVLVNKTLTDIVFTPMVSITLDRDLILNVYVPVIDALTALEFAGKTVDLASLERTELDGIEYYVIRTPLAASLAAGYLPMKATITAGNKSATKSYTFSTIRYAELVLAGNSDIEKALVKDVLSYVRAAYAYFGTEDATAIAAIDAILGEGYDENNKHTDEGSADSVTTGLAGATLVLDATPAIRFYLAEGADASAYEFFIGESKVKTTTGTDITGAYIEIDVYAYAMCETVTYTARGEAGGSYHIASYYAYATEGGDAKLIALVDRMWKYFQAARDYREAALSGVMCNHDYKASVKVRATAKTEGLAEYTCSLCGDSYEEIIPTTFKVLAIGNSFSTDAVEHLYLICKDAGIERIVIGNMYIGGCNLEKHLTNMSTDAANYTFYVSDDIVGGMVADSVKRSAKYGIEYDDWDYITIQQSSPLSGIEDAYTDLQGVVDYINTYKPEHTEIYWHLTWAFQADSTHTAFPDYNSDQMTMYNAIIAAYEKNVKTNPGIAGIIPTGTAIQNLRTSRLGDTLTRDGYHLSKGNGRYTAALTWLAALTGIDVDGITATPSSYAEVASSLDCIKDAVKKAINSPLAVTASAYPPEASSMLFSTALYVPNGSGIPYLKRSDLIAAVI